MAILDRNRGERRTVTRPLLATILLLLAFATPTWAQVGESPAGTVDLAAANRLVDSYARHVLAQLPREWREQEEKRMRDAPPRIDAGGVYQLMSPAGVLAFEYDASGQRLFCDALVHKLRDDYPRIGLSREEIQAALEGAEAAGIDTGGGEVFYDPVATAFFIRRTYVDPPDDLDRMRAELDRLTAAGERWFREHYLAAVLGHAETLRPPPTATGRDGDLRVTIVLTPDKRYQDLWRRPPAASQPQLVSRSRFTRGQEVWALALFSGATPETDGDVRLKAQYSFVYPDGTVHGSPVGNLWWSSPPPADHLQMSELRAAITLGPDAPSGDYRALLKVCEPSLERCVTAETPFRVEAPDIP